MVNFSISQKPLELTVDTGANISLLKPNNLFGTTQLTNRDILVVMGISTNIQLTTTGRVFPQMNINN